MSRYLYEVVLGTTSHGVMRFMGTDEEVASQITKRLGEPTTRCQVRNWAERKDTYYRKCKRIKEEE